VSGKTVNYFKEMRRRSPDRRITAEEAKALRASLERACRHPVSINTLPAFCGVCGKQLP